MSEVTSRFPTHPATAPGESAAPSHVMSHVWTQTPRNGKIEVAPRAIATVAGRAVAECYGVVGISARASRFGRVEPLKPEHYSRGVVVRFAHDHITIDLYVVLEHGLRIVEIAHNIMATVKFAVERTLGLRVVCVNVNVQALRVSSPE